MVEEKTDITSTTPPVVAADYFLIESADLQLRRVSRMLIASCGNDWWQKKFNTNNNTSSSSYSFPPPSPLREYQGLPVYPLDLPVAVLDQLLHLLRSGCNAEALEESWRHLPQALQPLMTLRTWRETYLSYYGFMPSDKIEDIPSQPPVKRQRFLTLAEQRIERIGQHLGRRIATKHPKYPVFVKELLKGTSPAYLYCHFYSTVEDKNNPDPGPGNQIDEGCVDLIGTTIGDFLGNGLSQREIDLCVSAALEAIQTHMNRPFELYYHFSRVQEIDEKASRALTVTSNHWPASPDSQQVITLHPKYTEIFQLVIEHKGKD